VAVTYQTESLKLIICIFMSPKKSPLINIALCLFCGIAAIAALWFSKAVLAPLVFALILAMLLIPLSRKLEKVGIPRSLAAVGCILILVLSFAVIFGLLGWQLSSVLEDAGQIKQRLAALTEQMQNMIANQTGIKPQQQKQLMEKANLSSPFAFLAQGTGVLLGIMLDVVLTLVYIFLLIYFRDHFLQFAARAVPAGQQAETMRLIREAGGVSQQYLSGLSIMIMCLWVMYGVGFSVIGVPYAIFFALLCGTLEMVPFAGNITGSLLTALITIATGGSYGLVAGILIVYGVVQFIQTYALEPLVVGRGINLNPFFTILAIVVGEAVWGIAGMVLALPLCGILKITCDRFELLKPYGFLLGGLEKQANKK
jgi:predicted PurR-regulated permease PerM